MAMETENNKPAEVVEISTRQSQTVEPERPALRKIQHLPQQVLSALIVYACQMRANGEELGTIVESLAEKFRVETCKSALSRYFSEKWYGELEKQYGELAKRIKRHPYVHKERRIECYHRVVAKAEAAGDWRVVLKAQEQIAREMGQWQDNVNISGELSVNEQQTVFGGKALPLPSLPVRNFQSPLHRGRVCSLKQSRHSPIRYSFQSPLHRGRVCSFSRSSSAMRALTTFQSPLHRGRVCSLEMTLRTGLAEATFSPLFIGEGSVAEWKRQRQSPKSLSVPSSSGKGL
jgi:hypothetical protein